MNKRVKEGHPPKKTLFYRYWIYSMKMVADRHRHAAFYTLFTNTVNGLLRNVDVDDLG